MTPGLEGLIAVAVTVGLAFISGVAIFIRGTVVICQRLKEINDQMGLASNPQTGTLSQMNSRMGEVLTELRGVRQDLTNHLIHHK